MSLQELRTQPGCGDMAPAGGGTWLVPISASEALPLQQKLGQVGGRGTESSYGSHGLPDSCLAYPGVSYSAVPMYLGELAPKQLRGAMGTMTEVFVIVGVFLAQIFSLQAILGNESGDVDKGVGRGKGRAGRLGPYSPLSSVCGDEGNAWRGGGQRGLDQ